MISKETFDLVTNFRDERDWKQFHNPKDLAISINLEASELLEILLWSGDDLICAEKLDRIKEELADTVNYCILLADACNINLDSAIKEKVVKNAVKYPVEKAFGNKEKYTELKDNFKTE